MSADLDELEQAALGEAYVKAMVTLFSVLVSGWTDNKEKALERFERGLTIHREAYQAVVDILEGD